MEALRDSDSSSMAGEQIGKNGKESRRAEVAAKIAQAVPGMHAHTDVGPMLRTGEVALLFGVSERCIRNWANAGKLPSVRTLGKHRLFPAKAVAEILRDSRSMAIV